jgi:hypothetical protein
MMGAGRLPSQFRLRTLVLLVAVIAAALEAYVLLRPSKPLYISGPRPLNLALRVARLMHDGDWDVDPLAVKKLGADLNQLAGPLEVHEVAIQPSDPSLIFYPILYLHGRKRFSVTAEDLEALRRHLGPGGGTLFADAACGSPAFDAAFRRFVAQHFPDNPLVPIPRDDALFSTKVGFDLSDLQYTGAVGVVHDFPQLEGIKIDGRWAVIYSKYGIGCAFERNHDEGCQRYVSADASKLRANVFYYSTLP